MQQLIAEWKLIWLWLLVWGAAATISGAPQECAYKKKAQLVALLALRSGKSCQHVLERGLQQEAALHLANYQLNSANPQRPQVEINVYDTCSRSEQAVSAVLQTLVRAQQGCSQPMFLGFIGPEEPQALQAVARVIAVFDYPHVTLQAVRTYSQYNTFEVETVDTTVSAAGIGMFLDELNWASFFMAFTADELSSQTASSLLEKNKYCVLDATLHIPTANPGIEHTQSYNRLLSALQKGENNKVLIIAEKPESVQALLGNLASVANKTNLVIYLRSTGILPWKTSINFKNVVILQETSKSRVLPSTFHEEVEKSPLWDLFSNETNCDTECGRKLPRDATTTNVVYATHLFHEALASTIAAKCKKPNEICPWMVHAKNRDWRSRLEKQTNFYTDPDTKETHKMKFHTFLPRQVAVISQIDNEFETVGEIINGESLILEKNSQLPVTQTGRREQCEAKPVLPTAPAPTVSQAPAIVKTTGLPIAIDVFGFDVKLGDFGYYELVGIITGVAISAVLLIVAMTVLVYRCFRVKVNSTFSSPSSTSEPKAKKNKSRFDKGRLLRTFSSRTEHTVRD